MKNKRLLNVCEIYKGFDGEVNKYGQGTPTVFLRLQGCNLKCSWCDTVHAQNPALGVVYSIEDILCKLEVFKTRGINKITITGGEPLVQQENLLFLLNELTIAHGITIETNGSVRWDKLRESFPTIGWAIDYKLESSEQTKKMLPIKYFSKNLGRHDFVKFVIYDLSDFDQAVKIQSLMVENKCKARFAYSSSQSSTKAISLLSEMMMQNRQILDRAVLNVQIHKLIWPNESLR